VMSFIGVPNRDGFAKHYELHYQPKKVEIDRGEMFQQFGYVNFHARCYQGSGVKLTPSIKKKWSIGWMREWFYCKVSAHVYSQGESQTCSALTLVWVVLSDGAPI
jgi:hypothetical protein